MLGAHLAGEIHHLEDSSHLSSVASALGLSLEAQGRECAQGKSDFNSTQNPEFQLILFFFFILSTNIDYFPCNWHCSWWGSWSSEQNNKNLYLARDYVPEARDRQEINKEE